MRALQDQIATAAKILSLNPTIGQVEAALKKQV